MNSTELMRFDFTNTQSIVSGDSDGVGVNGLCRAHFSVIDIRYVDEFSTFFCQPQNLIQKKV